MIKIEQKKITGIFLTNTNNIRVANSKHEEVFYQYQYLKENILLIKNMKDYFDIYDMFLKFNGNVQFIKLVEGKVLLKYETLIKEYQKMFPNEIKKIRKNDVYNKDNLTEENYLEVVKYYELLHKYVNNKRLTKVF